MRQIITKLQRVSVKEREGGGGGWGGGGVGDYMLYKDKNRYN